MEATCRILLLGESNPLSLNPEHALYCYPPGCAGYRLQRFLGLPDDQYLALHRMNLCEGEWSKEQAKQRIWTVLDPEAPWRVVVLLGRKVTEAFEKFCFDGEAPFVPFTTRVTCPGMTLVCLPHPSGRNAAAWNLQARKRAQEILRDLVPDLPWGSTVSKEAAA